MINKLMENQDKHLDDNDELSQVGKWKFKLRLFRLDQPLWLPKGSIRAIITLIIIFSGVFCYMKGIPVSETMNYLMTTIMAFYFGSRMNFDDKKP